MTKPPPSGASAGVALIAVLWVLALLSVLAGAVVVGGRTDIALAGNLVDAARAQGLADGAVRRAALTLAVQARQRRQRGDENDNDNENADQPPRDDDIAVTLDNLIANGERWPVDASPVLVDVGGATVTVRARDEGGLIDIGAAPQALVASLFRAVGVEAAEAMDLAAEIADYVDPDDDVRPGGAEAFAYRAADLPEPSNRPLRAPEQVLAVLGMSHDLYVLIEPAITVYTRRPSIDPDLAPPLARAAFKDRDSAESASPRAGSPSAEAGDSAPRDFELGTRRSRGRVFRISAAATLASGAVFIREAVIRLGGRGAPYTVVRWRCGSDTLVVTDETDEADEAEEDS